MTKEIHKEMIWENRLALWLPGKPLVGGFIIAVCLSAAYLGFVWSFDLPPQRWAVLLPMMIAYAIMVPRYLAAGDTVGQKVTPKPDSPADRLDMEISALQTCRGKIRKSRYAGGFGVVAAFVVNEVAATLEGVEDLVASLLSLHSGTAILPMTLFLGWVVGRSCYFARAADDRLSLPDSSEVDLHHLDELYALGRTGLRKALVGLLGVSIAGLLLIGTVFGLWAAIPTFVFGFVIGLIALMRPALKVRKLIRIVKREELARLEPLIRRARDDLLSEEVGMPGKVGTDGRLTDLVTYQASVRATPEWSFNSTVLMRFGLYLLIPVISMVCGALVERFVDTFFD